MTAPGGPAADGARRSWSELSAEERRDLRFAAWLDPDIDFESGEAREVYRARVTRLLDAIQLESAPDRVPVITTQGFFPGAMAGLTPYDCMHDFDGAAAAWTRYNQEFQPDVMCSPVLQTMPARAYELIDYRLFSWPGHGVPRESGYQYNEGEYMRAEEYRAFIADPTYFLSRRVLPRMAGAYEGLSQVGSPLDMSAIAFAPGHLSGWAMPAVQASLERLTAAGREMNAWSGRIDTLHERLMAAGFPPQASCFTIAPFDFIGDNLRGTREILLDLFRYPDVLLEASDRLAEVMVQWVLDKTDPGSVPGVIIPLHKGADGFMSVEQFETFYWPSLRKVILGLVEEGFVPWLFAEGTYNSRLEVIADLPRGKVVWWFDRTDMSRAKEVLGEVSCIQGNVPVSLVHAGTEQEMVEYCRNLIDVAATGGGFILDFGAGADSGIAANVHAMVRTAKEYGRYPAG